MARQICYRLTPLAIPAQPAEPPIPDLSTTHFRPHRTEIGESSF